MKMLDNIDLQILKTLSNDQLSQLSEEIRTKIINVLSVNGGHLSSNLGIVELTIAIHKVFDSPNDKIFFDTSHQTYTHKILTGRDKNFHTLRQFKGVCGFSDPSESIHDHYYSGHAGAALSIALGVAKNRDRSKEEHHVIALLGDGSFTCGLTLEALNNIPSDLKKFIVILNDNKMAISESVGNFKNILSRFINNPKANRIYSEIQNKLSKIPNVGPILAEQGKKIKESLKNLVSSATFFEHFGLSYVGPIDGHNIKALIDTLILIKDLKKPVLVHVLTQKGKGLAAAIANPTNYHGVKSFDIETGQLKTHKQITFPEVFGQSMIDLAKEDSSIVVLSPAMISGSSLSNFKERFPDRCFDVGIAEGHCLSYAGGLAFQNKTKVVVSIYSSFLQRAFDNLFHDICLQRLSVLIAIDRAGLSGHDGTSHHGIYDIGFLKAMPNLIIAQPRNGTLLQELLCSAFKYKRPIAIRYPNLITEYQPSFKFRELGKGDILKKGKDLVIITLGHLYKMGLEISSILNNNGIDPTIVDPVFLKPLDFDLLIDIFSNHKYVVTIEEHAVCSGLGSIINNFAIINGFNNKILNFGIIDTFVQHGKNELLLKELGIDSETIAKKIIKEFELKSKEEQYDHSHFSK